MADKTMKIFRISGRVIDMQTREGMGGLRVEAWDRELILKDPVASAVTDASGAFQIRLDASHLAELFQARRAELFFKVFRDAALLESTGNSVLWNITTGKTKIVIEVGSAKATLSAEKLAPPRLTVRGQVLRTDGSPAAGVLVRAYDQDRRGENFLGETPTDEQGRYEIPYTEEQFRRSEKEVGGADLIVRVYNRDGKLLAHSKRKNDAGPEQTVDLTVENEQPYIVSGTVRRGDGQAVVGVLVHAYDQDLRKKQLLGKPTATDKAGRYEITYSAHDFSSAEKGSADLHVGVFNEKGEEVAFSELSNAPDEAALDIVLPVVEAEQRSKFELLANAILPLLKSQGESGQDLKVEELEEDQQHQDFSFLSRETGFEKKEIARFVMAHRLAQPSLQAEFWFALLGGSFFQFGENLSLTRQLEALLDYLPSLDATAVRKSLTLAFNQKEIPEVFREKVADWIEAFLNFVASRSVSGGARPTFVKLALDHARIEGAEKQEKFARLFNEHKALTPELVGALEKDPSFKEEEIADLHTSFRLAELTQGDFSVVKMLKEEFDVRQPEKIRTLAKRSESEWVDWVMEKHAAGDIELPIEVGEADGQTEFPAAELYGKTLERRFREAFPTTAFAGGLERAMQNGGAHGLRRAQDLGTFLERHAEFELLNTPVDDFLKNKTHPDFRPLADDEDFGLEVKAVQRVFKLAPTFEATDTLLADDLHSAQKIYRMGESEFVRNYADRAGFTEESARMAWNRAADTHAAVMTVVGDMKAYFDEASPMAVQDKGILLSNFPNWDRLFNSGGLCDCEDCRSVLSPAAYFADLLMFLKDRKAKIASYTIKDILFHRRPDLGYLGLSCDNALTPLPYIDTVCEVLEDVVAAGENDRELTGLTAMPAALLNATLTQIKTFLVLGSGDAEISISQVDPTDPDRWVVHGNGVTYLLKKKSSTNPNFFAEILRNTEASAAELRAYPQYVNPRAYDKLRAAKYPLTLPFDLFAEEVRATIQKTNLQRWDLMRTLRGPAAPNNPTDGDIAAEYFGISSSANPADPSEKRLILEADKLGQRAVWGEAAIPGNLKSVKVFLQKTGLEYNELLALLDLKFINPNGDLKIHDLDPSCDIDKKIFLGLDDPTTALAALDRIHRFLRLWRKLKGWKMWELDLVIHRIGNARLNEPFLINLFYFSEVRKKLGGKTTVEQVCGLFGNLNTETRFTKLHEKRDDALYQTIFLNKRLIHPIDPAFQIHPTTRDLFEIDRNTGNRTPPLETISGHLAVIQAALGISETDLLTFRSLTKATDGSPYVNDDMNDPLDPNHLKNGLNLANLSFLWRHSWLARTLKFKAEEWKILLKLLDRDIAAFSDPKAAWEFLETVAQLKNTGFTPDGLNWLLAADRSAKAAPKEADAARFFAGLRKELQDIRDEYAPTKYDFLRAPTDEGQLIELLTTLLQKLNRTEAEVTAFLKILRGSVLLEASAMLAGFSFPTTVTAAAPAGMGIPIQYNAGVLRFSGLMTDAQRKDLLNDAQPALLALRQSAQLEAVVPGGLAVFTFPTTITDAAPNGAGIPIQYNAGALRFTGLMTDAQRTTLLDETDVSLAAVVANPAYRSAIEQLYQDSLAVVSNYRSAIEELYQQSLKAVADYISMEKDIALPGTFAFPATITGSPNAIPIRFEQVLRFRGVMTADQRTDLLAVTNIRAYQEAIEALFKQSGTAAVTGLPTGFTFPPAITGNNIPIRYEQVLRFTGVMTAAQRTTLTAPALVALAGAAAPAYQAAIDEFFNTPRLAVKFFETVFTAPLVRLPAEVDFKSLPDGLAAKIVYDAEGRLLRFTGIMNNAEKIKILALSADANYVAAVNSLADQPQAIDPTDTRVWLTDDDLDIALPANETYSKRLANAARKALKYLSATSAENAIVLQSSAQLGLTQALTRLLLTSYGVVPILPAPTPPLPARRTLMAHLTNNFTIDSTTVNSWFWANRVAVILKKWKITITELQKILRLPSAAKLLDFTALPLDNSNPTATAPLHHFLRTDRLLRLRDSLPETDITLLEVLGKLSDASYTRSDFAADVQHLNETWLTTDVVELIASLDIAYPAEYLLAESWERLRRAFYFLENLNASAATAKAFAAAVMTDTHAKTIKELLRSKFGTETWLALSVEIQDVLRESKRDALAAYILSQPKPADPPPPSGKWENTNDLYAYYLLDVEMASCQLTSRLVQASGSVQLFVQRCFMGLEQPGVVVQTDEPDGDSAWRWWKWMRKYRVWEANRKVFLWPENWIEPELKKDRSSFFKDLENELLQNEVDQHSVETAFSNYLQKLDGVAQLEIAGLFQEDDGDNTIVHVFGRTAGAEPHLYYYRNYDYRQWSPWEKVELDIQGDYLIPAVLNKRLFLFWPVFTEVPDEAGNSRMTVPLPGQKRFTPDPATKRLRLQMAVSDYRQGKWTPKKVSTDYYESDVPYNCEIVKENYRFFFIDQREVDGRVGIQCEGHSLGSLAAALKTQQDLIVNAADTAKDETDAKTAKTAADLLLTNARAAVAKLKIAVALAKTLIERADFLFDGNQNLFASWQGTSAFALKCRGDADDTKNKANAAYTALVPLAAKADDDAALDVKTFVAALDALYQAFHFVYYWSSPPPPILNSAQLTPYTKTAQEAAKTAAEAGEEALRTVTALKDAAAADAKSAGKDLKKAEEAARQAREARDGFHPDLNQHAFLYGVFDISGCTGVPEKANFLRALPPALRPESASVGYDANFQKWVELGSEIASRKDAPDDDFTLIKFLPPTSLPTLPNGMVYTQVLGQTPGIFKMSPAWHLSYFDQLWFNGRVGVLLPFFYSDKQRTFFVPASIWSANVYELHSVLGNIICNYPQIKKAVSQLKNLSPSDMRTLLNKLMTYQWFHFKNFYHPFVRDFARSVNNPLEGIPGLMSRGTQLKKSKFIFQDTYQPTTSVLAAPAEVYYPTEQVDFTPDGAYSPYNWELFFHAPLLIANALSKNQRFEEAREWYHFIFNPIGVESSTPGGSVMSKYWITKPFFETTDPQYIQQRIDSIMRMLAGDFTVPGYSLQAKKDLEDQVVDWRTNPFEPHRIANYRTVAYQKTVVMKYLDNLIAWGDYLFRQDSMESINEATQLYILAAEILGPRPKIIPPRVKPPVASFNELETEFDKFSNALVQVENLVPVLIGKKVAGADQAPLPMLYFCIPQNDKMLGYWDTVADRLYKIRHCMNIEGVVRQLALFEPPIDPAALVKAVAGGVDISTALADLNAPLPLYRFNVLLQKANEICNDVKALGASLLAALEKKDAETMGLLRQSQEIRLLEAVKSVREKQIEEAKENLAGLKKNKELVTLRRNYYQNIEKINASETLQQDKLEQVLIAQQASQIINIAASVAHIVPTFDLGVSGFGGTPKAAIMFGGPNVGSSLQATAGGFSVWANAENHNANKASINAGHERRWDDWKHQESLANKELEQLEKSIATAEMRVTIAEKELDNHVLQMANAKATDEFMRTKYTNEELFNWQIGQISGVYFQSYKLAYDLAKRAERCFRFELGLPESSYINFGYWDSLKKGLMSGEKLQYDLRRLESAYLEQNRREFELTKHISLAMLDPLALIKLRETGRCFVRLPEEIFDLDYPGHYFRRIKSVSLTLPCVVGPYTTISCTLRLLKNSIRMNTANGSNGYPRNVDDQGLPADDERFIENNVPVKAIAASSAQNDSGIFELNFRDERYLPFEGAGAISEWALELFNDAEFKDSTTSQPDFGKALRQFDYNTISDVILHVKYTAREDAGAFKNASVAHLRSYFSQEDSIPALRMFNLRQEFPTQWSRFLNPVNPVNGNVFELEMSPKLFSWRDSEKTLKVNTIWVLARCADPGGYTVVMTPPLAPPPTPPAPDPNQITLIPNNRYGGLHFGQIDVDVEISSTASPVKWQIKMSRPGGGNLQKDPLKERMEVEDLMLVLGYQWE